jgi:negative regulator of flagellin synthesis FlgM
MTQKIDGLGQPPMGAERSRRSEPVRPAESPAANRSATAPRDQVTLTGSSRQLQRLAMAVAAAPEIDMRRVEALRALIDKGHYELDARRIADRIADFEREIAGR